MTSIFALVTPLISISETFLAIWPFSGSYTITMTIDIWAYVHIGGIAIYLPSLNPSNPLPALVTLPLGGVVVILGMVLLGISGVPIELIRKKRPALDVTGGVLILLGPILFFALLVSVFASAGTGVSLSLSNMQIGYIGAGTFTGFAGGILGIVAGIVSRKD